MKTGVFGVLKLVLHADSYAWKFVPIAGQAFTDSGTTPCHWVVLVGYSPACVKVEVYKFGKRGRARRAEARW